jgi:hypothetical protein
MAKAGAWPKVPAAVLVSEAHIVGRKIENAVVFDRAGKPVGHFRGNEYEVTVPDCAVKRAKGGILTHNHPMDTSFSPGDAYAAASHKLGELRVVGVQESGAVARYRLRPGRRGWPDPKALHGAVNNAFNHQLALYRKGQTPQSWSWRKANEVAIHRAWQQVAKRYGMRYSQTLWGAKPAATRKMPRQLRLFSLRV